MRHPLGSNIVPLQNPPAREIVELSVSGRRDLLPLSCWKLAQILYSKHRPGESHKEQVSETSGEEARIAVFSSRRPERDVPMLYDFVS